MSGRKRQPSNGKKSIFSPQDVLKILHIKNATKIWLYIIQTNQTISKLEDIPFQKFSIGENAKQILLNEFVLHTTKIIEKFESTRGDTIKLLIELFDGHRVETVIMKHHKRTTVCLSSQVGCAMGCRFCATGTMGIIGNLDSAEIIEQLVHCNRISLVRNVVFMGMGEPLNNYENVKSAALFFTDTRIFSLSPRHVTISTVGVIKNMYRLSDELQHINLALSLHAPNQTLRKLIIPTAGANPIEQLMIAIKYHIDKNIKNQINDSSVSIEDETIEIKNNNMKLLKDFKHEEDIDIDIKEQSEFKINSNNNDITTVTSTNNSNNDVKHDENNANTSNIWKKSRQLKYNVMIEYILIADINDSVEVAHELGRLLQPLQEYILLNLIPYNPTEVKETFQAPSVEAVERFKTILFSSPYFIHTRVRVEMGQDIASACGQLVLQKPSLTMGEKLKSGTEDIEMEDFSLHSKTNAHVKKSSNIVKSQNRNNTIENNSDNAEQHSDLNYMNILKYTTIAMPIVLLSYYFLRRKS